MEKDFKESIADFAKVPFDDVHILGIKQGSVIIDFKVNFKSAYGDENDASTPDDNKNEENSSSSSSSSSSGLKESAENIDNNIDNNNDNDNDEIKSKYPPHLTINKSQEAFTNALRVEQPSVIFKNAKTRIMQNSKVSLLALEDLQENSIQAWRNDIESAFIDVTVTDIIDENDYNSNTLIHEEEEHQQENNATKKTAFVRRTRRILLRSQRRKRPKSRFRPPPSRFSFSSSIASGNVCVDDESEEEVHREEENRRLKKIRERAEKKKKKKKKKKKTTRKKESKKKSKKKTTTRNIICIFIFIETFGRLLLCSLVDDRLMLLYCSRVL